MSDGLGDKVEKLLASMGVTPERYTEAKQLFGLPPTCNCASRKRWLNKVGAWVMKESPATDIHDSGEAS